MTGRKRLARRPRGLAARSAVSDGRNKRVGRWICLALVLLAVIPYLQTLRNEFVNFDDGAYVSENPIVQHGLNWNNIVWAFRTMTAGNWHPVTWLSHMFDCQIFGLRPGWHHLINVVLHGWCTVILFIVLRRMTGMMWRSGLVAALFAVHPLHVESVAWIAERKDVLSTFFGLLSIAAYVRYVRARSFIRYALVVGFFCLSLMSKPMLVTLPFVLWLLDFWPLKRFNQVAGGGSKFTSIIVEKLPLLAISAVSSVVTFKAQHAAGAVAPIDVLPLSQRLVNSVEAYVKYLWKMIWPVDLAVFYPRPDQMQVVRLSVALVIMVGITVAVLWLGRKRPWLPTGWFWFIGTLVPVIGLVQVGDQSMADRYTYLPLIGIFIMIVWSVPDGVFSARNRSLAAIGIAVPLLALFGLTFRQVEVWKDTETLFQHAIEVTNDNFIAHNLLAGAFGQEGDLTKARTHIEKALEIKPNYAGAHYNLGMIHLYQRDFAKAEEQFSTALQNNKLDPMIYNALGVAQINVGKIDEAIANYRRSLELNPNFADAYTDLGSAFLTQKKFPEAVEMAEKALRLRPGVAETHEVLGAALWNLGRADESISHHRKAIELNPNLPGPRLNLGIALFSKRNYDEAIEQLEYALRLNPDDEVTQRALSAAKQKRDETGH